ncbi:MAG: hypothetical protein LUE98_15035 [Tannerellaceae bacterium]|nr:hypothetical protein [Tannerellaceae bacterium]
MKFNKDFIVKTSLGTRKKAYLSLFTEWYNKAKVSDEEFNEIDFSSIDKAKSFDQSYINPDIPEQVSNWHNQTYDKMKNPDNNKSTGNYFFNPK